MPPVATSGQGVSLIVIGVYLVLLVAMGFAAKVLVRNTGDYFRSGSRGTWWLAGSSIFMGNFSAWTFTGAAAMAYDFGWSILAIYLFPPLTALIQAWWVAPRFRQLRATTVPEIIRMRWGPVTQQFYAILQVMAGGLISAISLYGLSIFISAFFGISVPMAIVIMGAVVLAYSTIGGSWAVMATDYVQSLLVVGMVAITACLSLWHLGGLDGMFAKVEAAGLTETFSFFKPSGAVAFDKFTITWVLALGLMNLFDSVSLTNAVRYFSVKDGKEARKAALFLVVLSLSGVAFWFLPPIAGRLLYHDAIMATPLERPAEGAFAVTSLMLLPAGMAGLLGVAIISTTLSAMDVGLNRNAAIIVQEIYPAICRLFRWRVQPEHRLLVMSRWVSMLSGVGIVLVALAYASQKELGIFDIMQTFTSLIALPLTVPMALALLFRRVPSGAALVSVGSGLLISLIGLFCSAVLKQPWTFHFSTFAVTIACTAGFLLTRPFWRRSDPEFYAGVGRFFEQMERPVDFAKEVGEANDAVQLRLLGTFTLVSGALAALLLATAHSLRDVMLILAFCSFLWIVGGGMLLAARKSGRRSKIEVDPTPAGTAESVLPETVSRMV